MNEKRQVLRIGIDGAWEVGEFATSLNSLNRLYAARFVLALELEEIRELRDFYMDMPFPWHPRSKRSLRTWARLAPPDVLRTGRSPIRQEDDIFATGLEMLEPDERLMVERILYGSPGIQDIAGVGEIVGHLKDLIVRIIDHWSTKQQCALENKRRELENQQLQVQIAKEFVGLVPHLGNEVS